MDTLVNVGDCLEICQNPALANQPNQGGRGWGETKP